MLEMLESKHLIKSCFNTFQGGRASCRLARALLILLLQRPAGTDSNNGCDMIKFSKINPRFSLGLNILKLRYYILPLDNSKKKSIQGLSWLYWSLIGIAHYQGVGGGGLGWAKFECCVFHCYLCVALM